MTAIRATTPNPDCEVCGGTGTDPVFYGDCSECWPVRFTADYEDRWHARREQWAIEHAAQQASEDEAVRIAGNECRLRYEAWRTRPGNAAGLPTPTRQQSS